MSAAFDLLAEARRFGITIRAEGDRLKMNAAEPPPADLLEKLRTNKSAILAALTEPESQSDDFEERAALVEYGADVPREWAEGFTRLCTMPRPAAYSAERWSLLRNDAGLFLDAWAHQVAALGWTTAEVFGVHHVAPEAWHDCKGLVPLLNGWTVAAVAADRATVRNPATGKTLSIYRKPDVQGRMVIWELNR